MTRSAPVRGVAGALAALSLAFCPLAGGQPKEPAPTQSITEWKQPLPPPPGEGWPANPFAPPKQNVSGPPEESAGEPPAAPGLFKDETSIPRTAWENLRGEPEAAPPVGPLPRLDSQYLFREGCSAFDAGNLAVAAMRFEALLKDFPNSDHAAEALYRLGTCRLLENDTKAGWRAFDQLLIDHPDSTWTQMVARSDGTGERVAQLADSLRRKDHTKQAPDALRAMRLYEMYVKMFPKGPIGDRKKRSEIVYRMGDCARLAGREEAFQALMADVVSSDPKGKWAKLARLRLGGPEELLAGLTDLVDLEDVGDDGLLTLIDLAEQHLPAFRGKDRATCLFYRAVACEELERAEEAEKFYREVMARHADSPRAADAALCLAESRWRANDFSGARAAYADLIARFPNSPRARQALRWLGRPETSDADWAALEAALGKLADQLVKRKGGLRLNACLRQPDGSEWRLRAAMNDPEHFLAELTTPDRQFLLASDDRGAWYRRPGVRAVAHGRERLRLPVPVLWWNPDPEADSAFCWGKFSVDAEPGSFGFSLPKTGPSRLVAEARLRCHLSRIVRHDGPAGDRVTFRLEAPARDHLGVSWVELQFAPDGRLSGLRGEYHPREGSGMGLSLSELTLGGKVPPEALAFRLPEGVPVEEVERVEVGEICLDLFADLMHEMTRLPKSIPLPKTK